MIYVLICLLILVVLLIFILTKIKTCNCNESYTSPEKFFGTITDDKGTFISKLNMVVDGKNFSILSSTGDITSGGVILKSKQIMLVFSDNTSLVGKITSIVSVTIKFTLQNGNKFMPKGDYIMYLTAN